MLVEVEVVEARPHTAQGVLLVVLVVEEQVE
jgi:hypothetical protein